MSRVKSRNTRPELTVRRGLWATGLRYRLNDRRLPGKPDLVFPSRRITVFVHGCFWHGHQGCPRHRIPKSRVEWWTSKIRRNIERDAEVRITLERAGWAVFVIWECETERPSVIEALAHTIKSAQPNQPS